MQAHSDTARTHAPNRTNLINAPRVALLGRDATLASLASMLGAPGAVVTVTGPPGVGKSSVLRALAVDWLARSETAEAWWLDATELEDIEALLIQLAHVLELPREPNTDIEQLTSQLTETLATREGALIVFDNVEHLATPLAETLRALRGARPVVACALGSRVALPDDHPALALAPLEVPAAHTDRAPLDHTATALLVQRARQLSPQRRWDEQALRDACTIVRLLDGLPLAIELGAAQLRVLSPAELATRLTERGLQRGLSASRSRILEAAISCSWGRLSAQERAAMGALAAFRGGWSLELAEAMLARTLGEEADALELLEALAAHSLITRAPDLAHQHTTRWTMLLSIRDFAWSRHDAQEQRDLLAAHAAVLGEYAHHCFDDAMGQPWHDAVAWLLFERANLEHAMSAPLDAQTAKTVRTQLVLGHTLVLWRLGAYRELEALVRAHRKELRAQDVSLSLWASFVMLRGDLDTLGWREDDQIQRYLELLQHDDLSDALAMRLHSRLIHDQRGELTDEEASHHTERALALARERGDLMHEARVLNEHAMRLLHKGKLTRAIALAEEATELARASRDVRAGARAQVTAGFAYQFLGRRTEALSALDEALRRFRLQGDHLSTAHTLRTLAWYCVDERLPDEAALHIEELHRMARRHGLLWARGIALFLQGHLRMEASAYADAAVAYERALFELTRQGHVPLQAAALLYLSFSHELRGDTESAREAFAQASGLVGSVRSELGRAQLLGMHAAWLAHDGEKRKAKAAWADFLEICDGNENPFISKYMLALNTCLYHLPAYIKATEENAPRKTTRLAAEIFTNLAVLIRPEDPADPVSAPMFRGPELRLGMRLLEDRLPEALRQRFRFELRDPFAEALLVNRETGCWRPPGARTWYDFSARSKPLTMFLAMLDQRVNQPGVPLDAETLRELVWPDELMLAESANNRLYVTINTLRKGGLRDLILNEDGGYLLDPDVLIIDSDEVPDARPQPSDPRQLRLIIS